MQWFSQLLQCFSPGIPETKKVLRLALPALGVAGFGYASVLQGLFYFSFTTFCLFSLPDFKKFDLLRIRFHQNWDVLRQLFKTGWPISLQITAEMVSIVVCATFVGWLGSNALAAYQVIIQYQFLIVVPIFAVAQASGVLVGQALGAKQFAEIKKLGHASLLITVILSVIIALAFLFFPKPLSSLYLNVNDPNNQQILQLIGTLFVVLAISQLFDAVRNVLTGLLRGLFDTRFPMMIGLLGIWLIGIPLSYVLAFTLQWNVMGVMLGGACGMLMGAIVLYYRWHAAQFTA